MIKTFLILTILQQFLYSGQILVVISDNFKTSKATITCYEDNKKVFDTIEVNLGRNGLGWGLGEVQLTQRGTEPTKQEGDGKAPAGIFKLTSSFGYAKKQDFNLNYQYLDKNLICVDDSSSKHYNKIIKIPKIKPKSFEIMRRDDHQYKLGIVVEHNKKQKKMAGSCIFLHVEKFKGAPTAGCTSMSVEDLEKITAWIDGSENPILIQIPKSSLDEVKKLYPNLPL